MNDIENKVGYIADYSVTRPITIEEELNLAIKEYIWRFFKIVDPNSETLAATRLFTNEYSKDYVNIIVEAVKSSFNFMILMLLKDKTVFNSDNKYLLIDRFVIEHFEIKTEHLMDKDANVCIFIIKYYKEYDGNILTSPIRIETKVALNDFKSDSGDILMSKGHTIHYVDADIIYNPDVKMDYDLTNLVSNHVESFNNSFFEFRKRMVKALNTSEKLDCKRCLNNGNNVGKCNLVYNYEDNDDIDIEKEFKNKFKFKGNTPNSISNFTINNDIVELINSVKFETDQIIFDFIKKELNY